MTYPVAVYFLQTLANERCTLSGHTDYYLLTSTCRHPVNTAYIIGMTTQEQVEAFHAANPTACIPDASEPP